VVKGVHLAQSLTANQIDRAKQKGQLEVELKLGTKHYANAKVTPQYFFQIQRRRGVGEMLDQNNVG